MKTLIFNSGIIFSNTLRGISSSLFNAFTCFAFTALNLQVELKQFVIFFTVSNLLLCFINWGLKDYSVKLLANQELTKKVFSQLLSARTIVFFVLAIALFFIPLNINLICYILIFVFFKFINNTIEAFSTLNNKNFFFALIDVVFFCGIIFSYFFYAYFNWQFVICLCIASEATKLLAGIILFYKKLSFQFISPISFLRETINYFLVAFFAFILSKIDFYISTIYLTSKDLINYHIYSSLIGLSQILITSFFSRQMVNWFKSKDAVFAVNTMRYFLAAFCLSVLALPCFYFIQLYFYKFTIPIIMLILVFFNLLVYSIVLLEIYQHTHQNKHKKILTGVILSSTINIILSFILIRYFDMLGAILANLISLFVLYLYFKISNTVRITKINLVDI